MTVLKISKLKGSPWKTLQAWMAKFFFSYESSTFRRPLQSLLLKYTAENSLVT